MEVIRILEPSECVEVFCCLEFFFFSLTSTMWQKEGCHS